MPKRISSKMVNQINPSRSQSSESSQLDAATIEEIAKIFMQTQTNIIKNYTPQTTTNPQEVLVLLQQINNKLENLQGALPASNNSDNASQQTTHQSKQNQFVSQNSQETTGALNEPAVSQELQKLFSTLLTSDNQPPQSSGDSGQQSTTPKKQQDSNSSKQNSSIAVQTAAQVLSQAQYELSNELEASLQSLKQVISESEKIANKISNLLGEENDQKQ